MDEPVRHMQDHHVIHPALKGAAKDLVTSYDADGVVVREAEWGGLNVSFQRFPKGFDLAPLLRGLPGDECQCPHWGYVTKGRMVVAHAGGQVAVGPGEVYYMPPGHRIRFEEDTELVELSPPAELAKTMAAIAANLSA
jgi:hypothetical protein